jgi:hypothetical protein
MPSRFSPARVRFGRRPVEDQDDDRVGRPLTARQQARRFAAVREAAEIVGHLPAAGESVHVRVTSRTDLTQILDAVLAHVGRCDEMYLATLGFSRRTLRTITEWLDAGRVRAVWLVASKFWRSHNAELAAETQDEFRARAQRFATADSHAKVSVLRFGPEAAYTFEGSANLVSSGSGIEQLAAFRDAGLADWHSAWIRDLIDRHQGAG